MRVDIRVKYVEDDGDPYSQPDFDNVCSYVEQAVRKICTRGAAEFDEYKEGRHHGSYVVDVVDEPSRLVFGPDKRCYTLQISGPVEWRK